MTAEEYLAEINGKIETLTIVCGILIAHSPDKQLIAKNLASILHAAKTDGSETPHHKSYINGIEAVISTLEESLMTVSS